MSMRPAKTQISLGIRPVWSVFAVCMKKAGVLSYPLSAQVRLWSNWADSQADLSLCWVHTYFVGFVMSWLKYSKNSKKFLDVYFNNYSYGEKGLGGGIRNYDAESWKTPKVTSHFSEWQYATFLYNFLIIRISRSAFIFIALLWKSGAILDLPCPSIILWFCHSVILSFRNLSN